MVNNTIRVLVVDDDRAIRDSLARALRIEGWQVSVASDGAEALTMVAESNPDVIVLDVMMPELDGLAVCQQLRGDGNEVAILMLTARVETADRVAGLDAGADDYLVKPFELDELLARIRALLRRTRTDMASATPDTTLEIEDLRLDPATRRVWRGDTEIELTRTEFNLLELLMRNQGVVLDHSTIYDRIWGYDFGPDSKNLAVYISYLRRKIDTDNLAPLIHTIRGFGYTLRAA
ncbi:MAG: response regulator transcription factor [Acidimicrobiia bacterium]